ncbi:uncharacterized protein LOC121375283 [Gigantopelta aegis]|uniref:uncharacterized protein LOC121375283 n=1 Tax=Gigantopelta aegis TaxID=1735272 RepID=UPI001B888801|nr:uncharacterized protein LOC121375283 [Gigantopelta aegis]
MYGTGVGKLTVGVVSLDSQQKSELWSKVGNQNNSWHCAAVNIARQTNGTFQVYIDARTGSDIRGDIAIDDLKLYSTSLCIQSECDSSTPTTSSPGSTSSNTPSETTSLSTSIKTTTYIDNSPKTTISNTVSTTPGIVIDTALYYMIAIPVAVLLAAIVIGIVCYCRKSSTPPSDDDADNISEYMELDESAITSVKHNGQIVFPQNIDGHVYEEPVSGGSSGGGYDSSAPRLPAKSQSIDDVDYIDMDADLYTTSSSAPRVSTAEESGMTAPPPCGNFGYITAVHLEQPNDP